MEDLKLILLLVAGIIQSVILYREVQLLKKSKQMNHSLLIKLMESEKELKKWTLITKLYASRNMISEKDELIYHVKVSPQLQSEYLEAMLERTDEIPFTEWVLHTAKGINALQPLKEVRNA